MLHTHLRSRGGFCSFGRRDGARSPRFDRQRANARSVDARGGGAWARPETEKAGGRHTGGRRDCPCRPTRARRYRRLCCSGGCRRLGICPEARLGEHISRGMAVLLGRFFFFRVVSSYLLVSPACAWPFVTAFAHDRRCGRGGCPCRVSVAFIKVSWQS